LTNNRSRLFFTTEQCQPINWPVSFVEKIINYISNSN